MLHNPVPEEGGFAASVEVQLTSSWSVPAVAIVGGTQKLIITSSVDLVQTVVIVQRKV
jgi:hypothetical protein